MGQTIFQTGAGRAEIFLLFGVFVVGEWSEGSWPISAAQGSSCEPVFLLEEGKKAGRWKFAIKVSNRAGLIFLKQLDCANTLFWSFPAPPGEIIITKRKISLNKWGQKSKGF